MLEFKEGSPSAVAIAILQLTIVFVAQLAQTLEMTSEVPCGIMLRPSVGMVYFKHCALKHFSADLIFTVPSRKLFTAKYNLFSRQ